MKKKILAVLLMATLALGVTACGGGKPEGELKFTAPEGFSYVAEEDMYYSEDQFANLNYITTENDGSFRVVTKAYMEENLESQLSAQFGETLDIKIENWNEITVDGYEAVDYTMSYEISGLELEQRQVIINGTDNYHYVTFTQLGGSDYNSAFQTCINSFDFTN